MDQINNVLCEVCNILMHKNCYETHIYGKKHITKQEEFDKVYKSIFVTGVAKFSPESLRKIFRRYGEVSHVLKPKDNNVFAFVQFVDKSSVEKALKDRLFIQNTRLFIHKYNKNNLSKSGNSSDTSSSTSQIELPEGQVGVSELPVYLGDPSECPSGQSVFEWQVHQFISQVQLPLDMYKRLNEVVSDLEDIFKPVLQGCRIIVFGSCGTTLAFKNSDVDLFLQCVGDQPENFVRREAKVMYRSRKIKIIAKIPSARVPILRFIHLESGFHCDINAKSRLGVCNSRLIRFLMSLDPRIRTLVMVIKFWATVCEITGSNQKMTSYSLVMLVIFYLQQLKPPILPPVLTLQQIPHQKEFDLGWECSFCDEEWTFRSKYPAEENNLSLKELLSGFFQFYDMFDYSNNVICPLLGHTIPVSHFRDARNLPNEMHLYKENIKNDPKMQFKTNVMLRMQDPFELCLNITRNVTDKTVNVFKEACKVSYDLCEKSDEDCLLKNLFSIKKEMLDIPNENISKFRIHFKEPFIKNTSSFSDSTDVENFELIIEAILLVMKEVCKLHVEETNVKIFSKIKKSLSSQDVHTSSNSFQRFEDSSYLCNADAVVWSSRRKTQKVLNHLNISLSDFEQEICISEALYKPKESVLFSFNLSICSFDEFKHNNNSVDLVMKHNNSKVKSCFKEFLHFIKLNIKNLVNLALLFIINTKNSSPEMDVKELLKKLFDLKQKLIPYLKTSTDGILGTCDEESSPSKQEKVNHILVNQKSLIQAVSNPIKTTTEGDVNEHIHKCNTTDLANKYQTHADPLVSEVIKDSFTTDIEDQIMISEFLEPTNLDKCDSTKSTDKRLSKNRGQFIITKIQNSKAKSTFTCEEKNPFLASIEKVALKSVVIHDTASNDYKPCKDKYYEVRTKRKSENKTVDPCEGMKHQEKEIMGITSHKSSSKNSRYEVEIKHNYNLSQQRPKVYLERPKKFRKPSNHKFAQYNFQNLHAENIGWGYSSSREIGRYGQQNYPKRNVPAESTNNDYQYCSEFVYSTRSKYLNNKRHRYQKQCLPTDEQGEWYPTRYKK